MDLAQKIVAIERALRDVGVPHAFGGALALAWCTQRARGTIDIDLNIFADVDRAPEVLACLPSEIQRSDDDVTRARADGQVRLWWDQTPVDIFLNTTAYHEEVATRVHVEQFAGAEVAFLDCTDLAVFKALFNRTQDWADLEQMAEIGTLDLNRLIGVITRYLGPENGRIARLRALSA